MIEETEQARLMEVGVSDGLKQAGQLVAKRATREFERYGCSAMAAQLHEIAGDLRIMAEDARPGPPAKEARQQCSIHRVCYTAVSIVRKYRSFSVIYRLVTEVADPYVGLERPYLGHIWPKVYRIAAVFTAPAQQNPGTIAPDRRSIWRDTWL